MATKHPLRRSCAFCRARKIKCSNETICEACRRQGADCIYDFEPPRPKSRTISQDSVRADSATLHSYETQPGVGRQRSSTTGSAIESPIGTATDDGMPLTECESVAAVLEQKFYENFSTDDGPRSSPWQERISAYHRSVQNSVRECPEAISTKFNPKNISSNGILSLVTQDLVGLLTDQFGSLGCHHVEGGGARFFLSGLVNDNAKTMFENTPPGGNPLSEYGQRQQTQLIDVWFSMHPLSFLVSKTLLLRELRDGTHDEILLSVMLADANFSIGDEVAVARGHVLLRWATTQLRSRAYRPKHQSQSGGCGVSTRIFSGISTAQTLMLLGWNAICSFQIKRAACYIGLAGRIATEIKEHISSTAAPQTSSRINGIDVFDVEKEVVAYLYWTTYSLSLWAFIQMGHSYFSALLPTSLTSIFLPVTEASSVIIQLDLVSENFSTLQKQKSVIREMWPLAHIASVIAYIFALYPQETDDTESPSTNFWQEAPLLALQRLQQGKPSKDIACVCREINRVLMESIHILNRQVTEAASRSLVLVVYHTMAIHFLFPMLPPGQEEDSIPAETVERLCSSTQEILQIFGTVSEQPEGTFNLNPSLRASFPDAFCLALDTCARALTLIHEKRKTGSLLMELPMIQAYEVRMELLASKLYAMAQNDFLNQGTALRKIRKHLKACARAFGIRSASNSSGVPSPENTRSGSSLPHSPLHSPPTTSVSESDQTSAGTATGDECSASFVSPRDTTHLPPPAQSRMHSMAGIPSGGALAFTPADELTKHDWQKGNEMFGSMLDPSVLGTNPADHVNVSDLVDMNGGWFQQMPNVMDFDITGPMSGVEWDWPGVSSEGCTTTTTTGPGLSEMDSVMFYFDGTHNKQQ